MVVERQEVGWAELRAVGALHQLLQELAGHVACAPRWSWDLSPLPLVRRSLVVEQLRAASRRDG